MEEINLGKNARSNVVHCPFNHSHSMPQKTLILHLTKCNDRKPNHRICPFNNLHVMDVMLLEEHQAHCPDRLGYDQIVYETNINKPDVELVSSSSNFDQDDESWGDDVASGITSNTNVIRTINQRLQFMKPPSGLTKSERKKHRIEIKKKYSSVDASYNPNISINDRLDSTSGNTKTNQQELFIGKRPTVQKK